MSLRVAASFVLLLLLGVSLVHVHAQASFAVDCFPSGVTKGKVVIPPTIALDNSMTVQIDINPRPGWGTSWLFHTSTGAQAVGLQLVKVSGATATLNFRVGSVTASSQVFALPASKFTSLAIRVRPTTPNTIDFIVDGRVVSTSSPANLGVLSQSREITLCHSLQFNGLIDNFAIWAEHKDANFVNSFTKTIPLASALQEQLEFWFPFDEGFGDSAVAITPTASTTGQNWIRASFDNAQFSYTTIRNYGRCQSWGDPHIHVYDWEGNRALNPKRPATPQQVEWTPGNENENPRENPDAGYRLNGVHRMTSCGDTFEVRVLANKQPSWWAHVNRAVGVRAYDRFYLITHAGEVNGLNYGAYTRRADQVSWTAVTEGTRQDENGAVVSWTGNSEFQLVMPQVGYIKASMGWAYINMDIYLDKQNCPPEMRGRGACDWTHLSNTEGINVDFLEWKYGANPVEPPLPVPEPACEGSVKTAAEATCALYAPNAPKDTWDAGAKSRYDACVQDICSSGDPELTADLPPTRTCEMTNYANLMAGTYTENACGTECPNRCSGKGTCNNGVCSCVTGWSGRDCGQPTVHDCYDLTIASDVQNAVRKVESFSVFLNQNYADLAAKFAVEDSIVIFPTATRDGASSAAAKARQLIVTLDSPRSHDGFTVDMEIAFVATDGDLTNLAVDGAKPSGGVVAIKFTAAVSNRQRYVVITGLPVGYEATIKVNPATSGLTQLLIGSSTRRLELDVLKVPKSDWVNGAKLIARNCNADTCAGLVTDANALNGCAACNQNTQCGFCVESGRCQLGDAAGPRRGQCRHWRYQPGNNNVSRRVTMQFGWPVTPAYTEVILTNTGATSVPVDIRINAGNLGNVWDVVLALESSVDDDLITMINSIQAKLLPTLQDVNQFPNLAFGLTRYGSSGSSASATILKDLGNVNPNTVWQYQRALESFSGSDTETKDPLASLLKIVPASGNAAPNWRTQARRLVVIQTSHAPSASSLTSSSLRALRNVLVQHRIVPVFAVSNKRINNLRQTYDNIVSNFQDFGFGLVLDLASDSADMHSVVQKAIRLAQGQIALVRSKDGYVDAQNLNNLAGSLNINGLNNNHRARYHIPITYDPVLQNVGMAELTAPGFGTAQIQDIPSEAPTCQNIPRVETKEDESVKINLQGDSYRGLIKPVQFRITSLPVGATLFQAKLDETMGAKIAVGDTVTHPSGVVIFLGDQDAHGKDNGATVYATFSYTTHDGCMLGGDCTVSVYVTPVNDVPVIEDYQDETNEDIAKDLTLIVDDPDFIPELDRIQLGVITAPSHGKLTFGGAPVSGKFPTAGTTARQLTVTYTPDANYNGADFFSYQAYDQTGASSRIHRFFLTIHPVNDAPTAYAALPIVVSEDVLGAISINGYDVDFEDKVSFFIELPTDFQGLLFATNCSNSCGTTNTLNQRHVPGESATQSQTIEVPATHVLYYLSPLNVHSCNENENPNNGECPPLTSFQFTVVDQAGAKSTPFTVPIFVVNVNDIPTADPKQVTFNEDSCGTVTLTGNDIDLVPGYPALTFELLPPFSSKLTIKHEGVIVNEANPKIGQSGVIEICSTANEFGDPKPGAWQWWYDSFTYSSYDGGLYSDQAVVDVFVLPINDAPIPIPQTVSTNEDTQVIISLLATDIDSDEFNYYIASLPDAAHGTLYHYDSSVANNRGAAIAAGRTAQGQVVATGSPASHLVVFVPVTNWFGEASFTFEVQDTDKYGSNHLWSVAPATVTIKVFPVNDPPTAGMENVFMDEDTFAVIELLGSDDYYGENAKLQAVITQPVFGPTGGCANLGYLYQYTEGKAVSDYTAAERITAANTAVTDGSNRVIYIPPQSHFNSDATVPYRYIRPSFAYKMVEIDAQHDPKPLESNEVVVTITINPINNPPTVISDSEVPVAEASDKCFNENCVVDEDLGKHYTETAGTIGLHFGGDDVERSTLDILITQVECPVDALLQTIEDVPQEVPRSGLSDATPFVLPTKINLDSPANCATAPASAPLVRGLEFAPALDANSKNGAAYCSLTYRVRDNAGAVSDTKTISIAVKPINDIPRATEVVTKLTIFEGETYQFSIKTFDVEGDTYKMRILSCGPNGQWNLKARFPTPIDCSATPYIVDWAPVVEADGKLSWDFQFVVPQGENGADYSELRFELPEDLTGDAPTPRDLYIIEIDVLAENNYPRITMPENGVIWGGSPVIALPTLLTDPDVDHTTSALEFTFTIQRVPHPIVGTLVGNLFLLDEQLELPQTWTLTLPELNNIFKDLNWRATQTRFAEEGRFNFTLNDNGNVGLCRDDDSLPPIPCAREIVLNADLRYSSQYGVTAAAVGAGSAVGAGAAAVLAALAYRRFRKRTDDSFQPWTFAETDEGAFNNPLYADTANHENPLYEQQTEQQ